jgi:predicted N-formylglutamate amidohydrolase
VNSDRLVVSCEHGGGEVPPAYAGLFRGHEALLATHRGWDPGALELAREMADALDAPLHAATTTRLLVDLNRSIGHRQLYSELTRSLSPARRHSIVREHYRPHRDAVEAHIGQLIAAGHRVVHVASHSFTPVLNGVVRRADVAWLYDPRRSGEAQLAARWLGEFASHAPGLRLRRNYPYQGRGDGLTALLRRRHGDAEYVGIELEVNQRFVAEGGRPWQELRIGLIESLGAALGKAVSVPPPPDAGSMGA